jgi:hypothetical protein
MEKFEEKVIQWGCAILHAPPLVSGFSKGSSAAFANMFTPEEPSYFPIAFSLHKARARTQQASSLSLCDPPPQISSRHCRSRILLSVHRSSR